MQPSGATAPSCSAKEIVRAMRERNAESRARVERHVASLRRIAQQLRASGR